MTSYSDDVDAAVKAGKELQKDRPRRTLRVEVQIDDAGDRTKSAFTVDLDDPEAVDALKQSVEGAIERSTGG